MQILRVVGFLLSLPTLKLHRFITVYVSFFVLRFSKKMVNTTIEFTLQYTEDLKKVNLILKMDVYVVVYKTKTPVDHGGDANPTWNFPMKFAGGRGAP